MPDERKILPQLSELTRWNPWAYSLNPRPGVSYWQYVYDAMRRKKIATLNIPTLKASEEQNIRWHVAPDSKQRQTQFNKDVVAAMEIFRLVRACDPNLRLHYSRLYQEGKHTLRRRHGNLIYRKVLNRRNNRYTDVYIDPEGDTAFNKVDPAPWAEIDTNNRHSGLQVVWNNTREWQEYEKARRDGRV